MIILKVVSIMKIRVLSLLLFTFWVFPLLFAQDPALPNPQGTPISGYNPDYSSHQMIADLDDGILFYQDCDDAITKSGLKQLILYSSSNRSVNTIELMVPNDYFYITSRVLDNEVSHFYFFNNLRARTIQLDYATTGIPDESSNSKKLEMNTVFTYNVEPKTTTKGYFAESNDKKLFSICLATFNQTNSIQNIFVIVYNPKMEVVWMEEFKPDFKNKQTDVSDFKLANTGKALLLLNTYDAQKRKQYNHELQLVSMFRNNDFTKFRAVSDFGIIQSMKLLVLNNGKYFVGGYYAQKQNGSSIGYVTYTFDPRQEKEIASFYVNTFKLNYKERVATGFSDPAKPNPDYNLKCDYLFELPDDLVVMLGEQYLELTTVDPKKKTTTYSYLTKSLFYHQFGLDGITAGYDVYPKPQIATSLTPARDLFHLGISYTAFQDGSLVYILHNDHKDRFSTSDEWISYNSDERKEGILILTRFKKIGLLESKMIMNPLKDGYYQNTWFGNGEKVYFGLMTKKTYNLEHFEILNEWEWE